MRTQVLHSPTLESVKMVEETIKRYNGEFGKYQLWQRLPKKMMYQTFQVVIDYLKESGKIVLDKDGVIVWIWNPKLVKKYLSRPDLFAKR